MRWHIELILQFALLCILWRKSCPRWFAVLIGVDFAASVLQLIPYRSGYLALPALIWKAGVVLALPLGFMALMESSLLEGKEPGDGFKRFWHARILGGWITGHLFILAFQTQALSSALQVSIDGRTAAVTPQSFFYLNHALLTLDASAFLAWSCLFVL